MVGLYFKQHDKSEKGGGRRGSTGACGCGLPLRMAKTGWGVGEWLDVVGQSFKRNLLEKKRREEKRREEKRREEKRREEKRREEKRREEKRREEKRREEKSE
ncbi:unnamed protein product [Leuciscus chuanchicus]